MVKKPVKKNDYMTVRDDGNVLRDMLDELRIIEGAGKSIPPDRTEMLRRILGASLSLAKKGKPITKM